MNLTLDATPQVNGLVYSQPPHIPGKTFEGLLASPPAASGSDEAWLALEIDADACTAGRPRPAAPDPAKSAP